jgi:hypothetical protein
MGCDWISRANPDKTSQASLLVALAECCNNFSKSLTSYKNVNDDADVVDDKDKMVAVKAIVAVQLVVKLTPNEDKMVASVVDNEDKMVAPILISEGA